MKLQKLTEKRWFWPALCAVSVVFGWWYLSITTCAPLGGDDELIKIHFHTNEPWKVLEYCASLGEIYDIVVEDMDRQSRGLKG